MSLIFAAPSVISFLSIGILLQILSTNSQNFDPNVNDKEYLDTIQIRLREEAAEAHHVLLNQTKVLQQVTRNFIETKIKENLFKVVRERVEMELEEMSKNNSSLPFLSSFNSSRQARQDEEDDDDSPAASTTRRPQPGLLPQLANVVSTFFGSDVNVTGYLTDATAFLPSDISSRIITAASLIDPARFAATTTVQPQVVVNGQSVPQQIIINGTIYTIAPVQPLSTGTQSVNLNGVAAVPVPQNTNLNNNNNNNAGNNPVPSIQNISQTTQLSQASPVPQSGTTGSGGVAPQQLDVNSAVSQPIISPQAVQIGTLQQIQQQQNSNGGSVANVDNGDFYVEPQLASVASPVLNFKGNGAITSPSAAPSFSNEDEEYDNNSAERNPTDLKTPQNEIDSAEAANDLPLPRNDVDSAAELEDDLPARDDQTTTSVGYLDEYPIVKYGIRFFQHFTAKATVPTTTEFTNVTVKSLDSIEEEEAKATSPATSTYKQVVQGGVYLYEGAREAYQLLQHVNKFLDRIGNRLDNYGYGAEEVGVEV